MIRSLTAPTLHEIIREMHQKGLDLADTDGTIHTNESGHYYVLFEDSESETGVLDTSSGDIGVSGAIGSGTEFTLGSIKTAITTETPTSGSAVSNASGNYIMPRSVTLEFTGTMPDVIDDGLGKLVIAGTYREVGSFNYATGTPTWSIVHPYTEGTVNIKYSYSAYPNTTAIPNHCLLDRVIVASKRISSAAVNPSVVSVFEESGKNFPVQKASFTKIADGVAVDDFNTYEADLGSAPSVQRDFTSINRFYRWVTLGASLNAGSVVLLYWKKQG